MFFLQNICFEFLPSHLTRNFSQTCPFPIRCDTEISDRSHKSIISHFYTTFIRETREKSAASLAISSTKSSSGTQNRPKWRNFWGRIGSFLLIFTLVRVSYHFLSFWKRSIVVYNWKCLSTIRISCILHTT